MDRGKRRLARQLLLVLLVVTIAGIWVPQAWVIAKFYAPFVFPSAIALFLGDATADAYLKALNIRTSSNSSK